MQPPPRKVKAYTQLRNIHNEQVTKLQTKHQQDVELLEDIRNFTKIRASVEKEYGQALLKLATTYLQKKPPPGIELKNEENQENKTVFGVWRTLLDETEKIAKARLAAAEVFSQQISENAKNVRANKLQVAKKCFENLRRVQEEVQQCVQEVDKTKKLYFEEEHMAHEARDKAQDAEEKLKKKKGRIFQSITSLQRNSQKFSSRREACDIQSTKARNDYILALAAANAHQSRFYDMDLPDILQSLDCDVSEKVRDYIQLMSRTELLTVAACNTSFNKILDDAAHITRQYTVDCFLQENQVLGKPVKYDFDPCDNDPIRTICTDHHADICLSKDAKKWSSAFMKDCRTLRDANKDLNKLLGQIAKGEKTVESSTGDQEDVDQKLEDIRNSIRKAETSKAKAEARLDALREGGVNVDEFLNSLDIDSLQIDDLSRKGSTASRGSRRSSRSDLNYDETASETNESFYEGDLEGASEVQPESFVAEASDSVEESAAATYYAAPVYDQDPTVVAWEDEPEASPAVQDVAGDVGEQDYSVEEVAASYADDVTRTMNDVEEQFVGEDRVSVKCVGLFSYEAANPDELSFVEQEELEIISEGDGDGWIKARNYRGEEGFIPQNYVEVVDGSGAGISGESFSSVDYRMEPNEAVPPAPEEVPSVEAEASAPPQPPTDLPDTLHLPGARVQEQGPMYCRAIYDYEPMGADELSFQEGQVIQILRKVIHDDVDDGWWEGEIDGQVGIFPSLMVEELKITGEPRTPMDDPTLESVPPPPPYTPPKPAFLNPPSQVILTQPTPDHERGEEEAAAEPTAAVSVLYNDPDFQLELPSSQQAHYQSQFSGSESECSDHDAPASAEGATYAPLVSSPETPSSQEPAAVGIETAEVVPEEERKKLPHQQTVTVVIDSPDEPPREFAQSDDDEDTDVPQVESPTAEEDGTAATDNSEVTYKSADDFEKSISEAADGSAERAGESQQKTAEDTSTARAVAEDEKPSEGLATEDKENNNATE